MKDNNIRSAGKPCHLADLDLGSLNESELDRYVGMRISVWLAQLQEYRLEVQAMTRRREKAISTGHWTADSAKTSKAVKDDFELLRATADTERKLLEFFDFYEKETGRRVQLPPGHRLIEISRHILSTASYKRYVYPHIADMHTEYFPALQAGDLRKARMIELAFYFRVLWPIIKAVSLSFKTLFESAIK